MDSLQPPRTSVKRKSRSPPSPSADRGSRVPPPPGASNAPQGSHTSLPSIHSLYLGGPQAGPPPTYPDERHAYPPATVSMPLPSAVPISGHPHSHSDPGMAADPYASHLAPDSDLDEGEQGNRPKQKRRRQALSCTECKRRKIKCDRAHPCGPCTRRGDQAKCQWHVIEPVDKYVSRSEFDDLKARFDRLEAVVAGRMQHGAINAAGAASGEMPTGSNNAIFAPQLADRGVYPPAAFSQPIAGPSHRTEPDSAYAAVEAYGRNPTQSPIASSYTASFPIRAQPQRASSPAPPPVLPPPTEQGGSPSGYITARRPSGSEVHFAGRVPGRSPPMTGHGGSSILAPPPQGYIQSPSRLPPTLSAEASEHSSQTPGDVRPSRRASTASITAPPRPHGGGQIHQLPPPHGGEHDPRYRER